MSEPSSKASAPPLLECTPEEGARRLALRWIDAAVGAADRVVDGDEEDALHDLRVALRKLRTVMRTYDDELRGSVKKKRRKRLGELTRATGAARDAEVQIAWLEEAKGELDARAQPGVEWLVARLRERREEAYAGVRSTTAPALLSFLPKLRRDLRRYSTEHVVSEARVPRRFAESTAKLLRAQADELASVLRSVRSLGDEERAHEARKDGKRLRYLLEPLRDEDLEGAAELVATLKGLQDLLGELNDIAVRTQLLREEIERAALERARKLADRAQRDDGDDKARRASERDEQPGLLALVRASRERRHELYAELAASWFTGDRARSEIVAPVEALADRMRAEDAGPPREIERKYLLSSLPEHVRGHLAIEIDQGYVPGERLHERLRRTKTPAGPTGELRWYRTIKLGKGVSRIELDEETSREIFARMWSLTKGRRVRKRRWKVPEGERTWEIDEFLDRELTLAEIELPTEDTEVVIPEWLAPHVVRDVTDEPDYVNLNLAR